MKIKVLKEDSEEFSEDELKLLWKEARKNTKMNKDGLTTISAEDDPEYFYDTTFENDTEDFIVETKIEPKTKEIWKVNYPFEDSEGSKDRPVLVLSSNEETIKVLSMKITGSENALKRYLSGDSTYVFLDDYKSEGLYKPSLIRVDKVIEIDKNQFLFKYGNISKKDWKKVQDKYRDYLAGNL